MIKLKCFILIKECITMDELLFDIITKSYIKIIMASWYDRYETAIVTAQGRSYATLQPIEEYFECKL